MPLKGDDVLPYVVAAAAVGAVAMIRYPRSSLYVLVGAVVAAVLTEYGGSFSVSDPSPPPQSPSAQHGPVHHRSARIAATAPSRQGDATRNCTQTTSAPLVGAFQAPMSKVVTLTGPALEEQKQTRMKSWELSHKQLVHPPVKQTNAMLDAFHMDHELLYSGKKDAFIEIEDDDDSSRESGAL